MNSDYKIASEKWVDSLPKSEKWVDSLSKKKTNKFKKYSFISTFFILGLILVSVIKNETRSVQKEINNLQASIDLIKLDLHKAELDYEVITSPKNLSEMAKKYLENELIYYNKSQIKKKGDESNNQTKLKIEPKQNKIKKITNKTKESIVKEIEIKKAELRKLQEIYENPSNLSKEAKISVEEKLKKAQIVLALLRDSPKEFFTSERLQRWTGLQFVKVFLGIPVIPGR